MVLLMILARQKIRKLNKLKTPNWIISGWVFFLMKSGNMEREIGVELWNMKSCIIKIFSKK